MSEKVEDCFIFRISYETNNVNEIAGN